MTDTRLSWKHIVIPAAIMAVLALYPQVSLWIARGADWNGSYAVSNYDEVAYSAYINALIDGKPRRNDPFVSVDDAAYESLYSIQFVPAYIIAAPARLLGITASTAFILLGVILAIAAALALFWLINSLIEDPFAAAAGSLIIMCLGTAAAFQGELRYLIEGRVFVDFFPFLRRYQPGFAFALFFVFCTFVWRSFRQPTAKRTIAYAAAAGAIFAFLVFSYFYLWTAAAAWLACFAAVSFIAAKENRGRMITSLVTLGIFAAGALVPYFAMLAGRSPAIDSIQLLSNTHAPDLASPSLIIGLIIAVMIAIAAQRKRIDFKQGAVQLALSFAITPVILFNQQVLTGRSLQPIHYEIFIANYLVLAAGVLLAATVWGRAARRPLAYAAAIAVLWGIVEAVGPTGRNSVYAVLRDESVQAIRYIERDRPAGPPPTVIATNFVTSDYISSVATIRSLWNPHTSSAGGVTPEENKRLFYLFLYYSGFTPKDLSDALRANSFEVTAAVFGFERALPAFGSGSPITAADIQAETRKFDEFTRTFDTAQTVDPAITHIIVPAEGEANFANLDRWYGRDEGKTFGLFKVYKLRSKPPA